MVPWLTVAAIANEDERKLVVSRAKFTEQNRFVLVVYLEKDQGEKEKTK